MEDLFDRASAAQVRHRIQSVQPTSPRQWGTMSPAQMFEHCARALEMAAGQGSPKGPWLGRLLGRCIKPFVLRDGEPMRRNVPSLPSLLVADSIQFEAARDRLLAVMDQFVAGGEAGCSTSPHPLFGPLTPAEWSKVMYKHLDHHLRQFSA